MGNPFKHHPLTKEVKAHKADIAKVHKNPPKGLPKKGK
jgi:hypothetical protein